MTIGIVLNGEMATFINKIKKNIEIISDTFIWISGIFVQNTFFR